MESETTDTVSYSPKYSFECDLLASERTVKEIYGIAKGRKTGSDCVRPFLVIDRFDPVTGGGFVAWYEELAIAVSSIDGEKKMRVSGDLNGQGDTVKGVATFDEDGKHYQFNGGTVVTATQYTGDKQDLIQNADKHYAEVERFLLSLVRSVIHIGKNLMGADVADNAEIEIDFDRSVIIDDTAERLLLCPQLNYFIHLYP